MWRNDRRRWLVAACFVTALVVSTGRAFAQESASASLAVQLSELMSGAQLDAVAAKDSEGTDRYVAALAFPGQLLVVSARYEVPMYVEEKIAGRQYREVYIDLNAASIADTKVLITDAGADGLMVESGSVDMYDTGARLLRFDGNPAGQQISDADYQAAFSDADAQYARMLKVLISEAQ